MLVSTVARVDAAREPLGERRRRAGARARGRRRGVDHRLERDDAGRRDHAGLAHPAAEPRPVRARLGDHVARRRTAPTPPARPAPSTGRTSRCRRRATSSPATRRARPPRSRCARRRSAPRGRASRATSATASTSSARHGRPHVGMCVFSMRTARDLRQVVTARRRRRGRWRRRSRTPSASGERVQLHARVPRRRRVLVPVHVRTRSPHSTSVPGRAEQPERELVRHRARRHVERGLLAEQRRRQRLEPVDGRVLAVAVVADLGVGHRAPHLGRRRGDGVGPEVDRTVRRRHVMALPARVAPSAHRADQALLDRRVTASVPSRPEDRALREARARADADGLCWWYSSHSSARNGRWNHIAWSRLAIMKPLVVPGARVRQRRGVEQRDVGRVRDDARVQQRIVGQRPVRRGTTRPARARAAPGRASGDRRPGQRMSIGRSRAEPLERRRARGARRTAPRRSRSVGEVVGVGHVGHRVGWSGPSSGDRGTTPPG